MRGSPLLRVTHSGGANGASPMPLSVSAITNMEGVILDFYSGDNVYDDKIDYSNFDRKIDAAFDHIGNLRFPFYVTIGNHDAGSHGNENWKADYQIWYHYGGHYRTWNLPCR
jgi:Calcineurin-like phosphoesterase